MADAVGESDFVETKVKVGEGVDVACVDVGVNDWFGGNEFVGVLVTEAVVSVNSNVEDGDEVLVDVLVIVRVID